MIFRGAQTSDIKQIQIVRHAVKEKVLSIPALVTDKDCEEYITVRGKGWVCVVNDQVVGFAIVDLRDHIVWALFVRPEHRGTGTWEKTTGNYAPLIFYRDTGNCLAKYRSRLKSRNIL